MILGSFLTILLRKLLSYIKGQKEKTPIDNSVIFYFLFIQMFQKYQKIDLDDNNMNKQNKNNHTVIIERAEAENMEIAYELNKGDDIQIVEEKEKVD